MAKQIIDKDIKEIKGLLKDKNLVIGTKQTMKYLKLGKIDKVFIASNCSEEVIKDLKYYKKIKPFKVVTLKHPNEEVGTLCKKPFSISVLSAKGGN